MRNEMLVQGGVEPSVQASATECMSAIETYVYISTEYRDLSETYVPKRSPHVLSKNAADCMFLDNGHELYVG